MHKTFQVTEIGNFGTTYVICEKCGEAQEELFFNQEAYEDTIQKKSLGSSHLSFTLHQKCYLELMKEYRKSLGLYPIVYLEDLLTETVKDAEAKIRKEHDLSGS